MRRFYILIAMTSVIWYMTLYFSLPIVAIQFGLSPTLVAAPWILLLPLISLLSSIFCFKKSALEVLTLLQYSIFHFSALIIFTSVVIGLFCVKLVQSAS
jgi:hypothetical protein